MATVTIHFDAGTRPTNPGPSAIGYLLEADGGTIEQSNCIGEATNNEAGYHALIQALETARQSGYDVVEVYGDHPSLAKKRSLDKLLLYSGSFLS